MKVSSIKYLVNDGFKNVFKNKLMSFASIGVLTACLVLIGSAVLFSMNLTSMLDYIKSQNEVVIFILDGTSEDDVHSIQRDISKNNNVFEYNYVNKDEALKEQLAELGDASVLYEDLKDDNVLPASIRVKLKNIEYIGDFTNTFESYDFVEKINSPTDIATSLISVDKTLKTFGSIVITILIIVSLVIVSNTIKISVFSRRREINIMKYVGATNSFIRLPFIVEGATIGCVSAFVAYGLVNVSYTYFINILFGDYGALDGSMFDVAVNFNSISMIMLVVFLTSGIITGVLGSLISSRKHLKV